MTGTKRIAILISGRGSNMRAILDSCRAGQLLDLANPLIVVSDRPEAKGLAVAAGFGVKTAVVPSAGRSREAFEGELSKLLEPLNPDFVVLAGFMRVLSPSFIGRFPRRIVNVHPADPAAHRGLHGYQWAFEKGLKQTWVTVHIVDEGVDTGPILSKEPVDLEGASTLDEVEARGLKVEHEMYPRILARFFSGALPVPKPGA